MEGRASDFERLIRFDKIRVSKLLEEIQFSVVVFILSFAIGSMTDRLFPVQKDIQNISDFDLIKDLFLQLVLITISAYYIMKIAHVIPFMFSLSNKYVASSHGESAAGGGLAMAIIFIGVQRNFQTRIGILKSRFT